MSEWTMNITVTKEDLIHLVKGVDLDIEDIPEEEHDYFTQYGTIWSTNQYDDGRDTWYQWDSYKLKQHNKQELYSLYKKSILYLHKFSKVRL